MASGPELRAFESFLAEARSRGALLLFSELIVLPRGKASPLGARLASKSFGAQRVSCIMASVAWHQGNIFGLVFIARFVPHVTRFRNRLRIGSRGRGSFGGFSCVDATSRRERLGVA